ncbi:hypothetical protein J6590_019039 [Homalodisca vitripennis]|nr:hypothetical protein J6590_019039 [Homalodisca vitripennis]
MPGDPVVTGCSFGAAAPKIQRVTRNKTFHSSGDFVGESWNILDHSRDANKIYNAFNELLINSVNSVAASNNNIKGSTAPISQQVTSLALVSVSEVEVTRALQDLKSRKSCVL